MLQATFKIPLNPLTDFFCRHSKKVKCSGTLRSDKKVGQSNGSGNVVVHGPYMSWLQVSIHARFSISNKHGFRT